MRLQHAENIPSRDNLLKVEISAIQHKEALQLLQRMVYTKTEEEFNRVEEQFEASTPGRVLESRTGKIWRMSDTRIHKAKATKHSEYKLDISQIKLWLNFWEENVLDEFSLQYIPKLHTDFVFYKLPGASCLLFQAGGRNCHNGHFLKACDITHKQDEPATKIYV